MLLPFMLFSLLLAPDTRRCELCAWPELYKGVPSDPVMDDLKKTPTSAALLN